MNPSLQRYAPWAVTAVLLALTLANTATWGRNIGVSEDWYMVPAWMGYEPDLLSWVWSQNNEHRLPVQRLIYLGLLRATNDFRSGMVFSQLLMAVLALLLVRAAAMARGGRYRLADIVFPLALLHLGHGENQQWGWQLQFVWSTFLSGLVLAVLIARPVPTFEGSLVVAAALSLLPLSGANGIAGAVCMFPWAITAAFLQRRLPGADRRAAPALVTGVVLSAIACVAYFIGYKAPSSSPPLATPGEFLVAVASYFAMATVTWHRATLNWSRLVEPPIALSVLAVLILGGVFAWSTFARRWRTDGARGLGLALFIGSGVGLGVIIAAARGALPYALPSRYALFAVMPLLAALAAWELYGPRPTAKAIGSLAALGFILLLPLNVKAGFVWRDWYVAGMQKVEADIADGLPASAIAERNEAFLLDTCDGCVAVAIPKLRDAGVAPFSRIPKSP